MGFREQKPIHEQVIVITGASSGIGLSTARLAASRGASLVLAARSPELESIAGELRAQGASVEAVLADVSREEDVRRIADRAIDRFGRIDTWINNAGTSVYGKSIEVPIASMRELFDTDFWGVVYGSRVAVERMRAHGGTLINVGSVVSDRGMPLQGAYSAAKHAVKGFTDALRVELEHDEIPVQVTLVKPATIDTPYFAHAENRLEDGVPAAPPPVYAPETVARALLDCAEHPKRELAVGMGGRIQFMLANAVPALADRVIARTMFAQQIRSEQHAPRTRGAGEERGDHPGMVLHHSTYAQLRRHAPAVLSVAAGLGAAFLALRLSARAAGRG